MKKIDTLHERSHPRVYWETLKTAIKKATLQQLIWAIRLAAEKLPNGKLFVKIGLWTKPASPRNCGNPYEYVTHMFQCHKGDEIWGNIKKVLIR